MPDSALRIEGAFVLQWFIFSDAAASDFCQLLWRCWDAHSLSILPTRQWPCLLHEGSPKGCMLSQLQRTCVLAHPFLIVEIWLRLYFEMQRPKELRDCEFGFVSAVYELLQTIDSPRRKSETVGLVALVLFASSARSVFAGQRQIHWSAAFQESVEIAEQACRRT